MLLPVHLQPPGGPADRLHGNQLRPRRLLLRAAIPLAAALAASLPALAAHAEDAESLARAALLHDLETIIEAQESTGWTIDRYEYETVLPNALHSVCSATPATRAAVASILDTRIAALGGPVEDAYRINGGDLSGLSRLLFATRARRLLAMAEERAKDECPFWMPPDPDFRGVQSDAGRFVINAEGGGLLVLHLQHGDVTPGGGGTGRLLLGYGLDDEWTLLAGPEFGGGALFKQSETTTQIPIQFTVAVPVVLRHVDLTWHHDLELAPCAFFTQEDGRRSYGLRVGAMLGIRTLRIRNITPWAGIALAFESYFENDVRPAFSILKGGLRLGFDWDF
jgi:hypothetical protein